MRSTGLALPIDLEPEISVLRSVLICLMEVLVSERMAAVAQDTADDTLSAVLRAKEMSLGLGSVFGPSRLRG